MKESSGSCSLLAPLCSQQRLNQQSVFRVPGSFVTSPNRAAKSRFPRFAVVSWVHLYVRLVDEGECAEVIHKQRCIGQLDERKLRISRRSCKLTSPRDCESFLEFPLQQTEHMDESSENLID